MDLTALNPEQQIIVTTTDGKQLVLAGAGAGKTMVLSYKTAYLIDQKLAKGGDIMAVTFTNKAASELKERITSQLNVPVGRWWIGTFHGLCVRMLLTRGKDIGIPDNFTIADETEQKKLVTEIIKSLESSLDPKQTLNAISRIKTSMQTIGDAEKGPFACMFPDLTTIYEQYHDRLRLMNALDFDDIIMKTLKMLENSVGARSHFSNMFRYILVDEAQDLDYAQYRLLMILSEVHNNLTLVGDLDQSIYGFRGAQPEIVRLFSQLSDVVTLKLEQNYRCTKTVIAAANAVVSKNLERIEKTLWTKNPDGEKIVRFEANNEYQEAEFVSGVINLLVTRLGKCEFKDFAVLARKNAQIRPIEDALSRNMIRYKLLSGSGFFERKEVLDAIAYLRILMNPVDLLAFNRVINEPKRGAGAVAIKSFMDYVFENETTIAQALLDSDNIKKLSAKTREAFKFLGTILQEAAVLLETVPPYKLIRDFITRVGYLDMLDEAKETDRVENVYQISELAKVFQEEQSAGRSFRDTTMDFLRQIALMSGGDEDQGGNGNHVTILTGHSAKGLEFQNVFIIGLEDGNFPSYFAIQEGDSAIEEERRLFYVALTRAKQRLYLTNCRSRSNFGKETVLCKPSRFLREVPSTLIKNIQ